jgi:hypothetical protein
MNEQQVTNLLRRIHHLRTNCNFVDDFVNGYALGYMDGYFGHLKPLDPSANTQTYLEGYVKGLCEGHQAK